MPRKEVVHLLERDVPREGGGMDAAHIKSLGRLFGDGVLPLNTRTLRWKSEIQLLRKERYGSSMIKVHSNI